MDIKPGTTVTVTVKKTPNCEAAAKTLSRLFAKDPANRKPRLFRKKLLAAAVTGHRRGGRTWYGHERAPRLFQPVSGDSCSLRATCDVIRDLGSVERFIAVNPS